LLPNIRAYDIVKEISRVERFISGAASADGAVIVLANDPSYWRPAKIDGTSNAAAFRVSEGVVPNGTRSWGPNTVLGLLAELNRLANWPSCGPWEEAVRIAPRMPGVYVIQVARLS
jgi:hypothetical protein